MWEQVIYVVIGGALAVFGGFIQSWYSSRKERDLHLMQKREKAYEKYIGALLELRENQIGSIEFNKFHPKYNQTKASLLLYSDRKVKDRIKEFDSWLYECWEVNFNVNDMINEVDRVIDFIRDRLNIK